MADKVTAVTVSRCLFSCKRSWNLSKYPKYEVLPYDLCLQSVWLGESTLMSCQLSDVNKSNLARITQSYKGIIKWICYLDWNCKTQRQQRMRFLSAFWCRIHLWFRYVGGFVRKVDDVTAYLAAQPSRLRAHHRNKLSLRVHCCCCRCILHLQQYSRRLNLFFFL